MSMKGRSEGAEFRGEILGPERVEQELRDEDGSNVFCSLYWHECVYVQVWARDVLPRLERALFIAAMLVAISAHEEHAK
ncbi:hypothetical protein H0A64_07265 [Alcaligenaceae bacterium]|nr:hypothetical protein [Alcaligenaceae bacterium]